MKLNLNKIRINRYAPGEKGLKVSYWKSFGLLLFLVACSVQGAEWSGNVAAEFRGYPNSPAWAGQKGSDFTLSFQPEFRHQWDDGDIGFTFIPFFRIGSVDEERITGRAAGDAHAVAIYRLDGAGLIDWVRLLS